MKIIQQAHSYFFIFLINLIFTISFWNPLSAQIPPEEFDALFQFYMATNGDEWLNNNNWLNEGVPVHEWFGIEVDDPTAPNQHIIAIDLPQNNLQGFIPPSIVQFSQLMFFNVNCNRLFDLPPLQDGDLPQLNYVNIRKNHFDFEDVANFLNHPNVDGIDFEYEEQELIDVPIDTCLFEDSTYVLPIAVNEADGNVNHYDWSHNGTPLAISPIAVDGSYDLNVLNKNDHGTYRCKITNDAVPNLVLERSPIHVGIYCTDSIGGVFCPNRLIVKFHESIDGNIRPIVRDEVNAVVLDTTDCNIYELWTIPDTLIIGNDTLIGPEEIKSNTQQKPEIEEADFNHVANSSPMDGNGEVCTEPVVNTPDIGNGDGSDFSTRVAIIDTGMDIDHQDLSAYNWQNAEEPIDQIDNDGNCIIDDASGASFIGSERHSIIDLHGHGTHVSGIVVDELSANSNVSLIPVKAMDENGGGSIFSMIGGLAYAKEEGAKVINMSLGYSGVENLALRDALEGVREQGIVVVTSAGNSGVNNDTLPHYPSSFTLNNIVSIAAINTEGNELDWYSNYGKHSVDFATDGTNICSAAPGGLYDIKSGTSMAAAKTTGVIAKVWNQYPDLTFQQVVGCLMFTTERVPALDTMVRAKGVLSIEGFTQCAANPPLANQLLELEALRQKTGIQLKWKTIEEQHLMSYELERKLGNESHFQLVEQLSVQQNDGLLLYYEYQDPLKFSGEIYYRLKLNFEDGHYKYSDIVNVSEIEAENTISVYPNPVSDIAYVHLTKNISSNFSLFLHDTLGKKVWERKYTSNPSMQNIQIDFQGLEQGIYYLSLKNGNKISKFKLLKVL